MHQFGHIYSQFKAVCCGHGETVLSVVTCNGHKTWLGLYTKNRCKNLLQTEKKMSHIINHRKNMDMDVLWNHAWLCLTFESVCFAKKIFGVVEHVNINFLN